MWSWNNIWNNKLITKLSLLLTRKTCTKVLNAQCIRFKIWGASCKPDFTLQLILDIFNLLLKSILCPITEWYRNIFFNKKQNSKSLIPKSIYTQKRIHTHDYSSNALYSANVKHLYSVLSIHDTVEIF